MVIEIAKQHDVSLKKGEGHSRKRILFSLQLKSKYED